jgi:hypothetical protein
VTAEDTQEAHATSDTERTVLQRFPAGGPFGSWPAENYAAQQREQGTAARVVMDLGTDDFLVIDGHSTDS